MKRHPIICGECGKIVTLKERRERDGIRFHGPCAEKRAKGYQERHRKLGLCLQCSRKPKAGLLYCQALSANINETLTPLEFSVEGE